MMELLKLEQFENAEYSHVQYNYGHSYTFELHTGDDIQWLNFVVATHINNPSNENESESSSESD
jgi:hypothetical protein